MDLKVSTRVKWCLFKRKVALLMEGMPKLSAEAKFAIFGLIFCTTVYTTCIRGVEVPTTHYFKEVAIAKAADRYYDNWSRNHLYDISVVAKKPRLGGYLRVHITWGESYKYHTDSFWMRKEINREPNVQ